jgi:hypothetical protein
MKNSNGGKILKKIGIHLLLLSFFVVPFFVYAAQGGLTPAPPAPTPIPIAIPNPFKGCPPSPAKCDLMTLITSILNNVVMPIAAVGVVMWIIYAGFTFITAQGKPAEIEKAKARLLWSLIGAGILLGAAAISKVVETTINALL